jgi:hypothetical protein
MKNGKTKYLKSKKRRGGKLDKDLMVTPNLKMKAADLCEARCGCPR